MQFDPYERGRLARELRAGSVRAGAGYVSDKTALEMVKGVERWLATLPAELRHKISAEPGADAGAPGTPTGAGQPTPE